MYLLNFLVMQQCSTGRIPTLLGKAFGRSVSTKVALHSTIHHQVSTVSEEFISFIKASMFDTRQHFTAYLHEKVVHAKIVLPAASAHAPAAAKGAVLIPATRPAEAGITPKAMAATPAAAPRGEGLLLGATCLSLQPARHIT